MFVTDSFTTHGPPCLGRGSYGASSQAVQSTPFHLIPLVERHSQKPEHVSARLSNFLQVLIFLPLTLSTLSKSAFLLLSLLIFLQSLIHGTLQLFWGSSVLAVMQFPVQPFLLLVCFNVFSESVSPWLLTAATYWGRLLYLSSPLFIILEGMSSLLVVQKMGQVGRDLVGEGEAYQFGLLIASAMTYVVS